MKTDRPAVGVSHPTVVPSNFQSDDDEEDTNRRRERAN
jgi:hypothetical protein